MRNAAALALLSMGVGTLAASAPINTDGPIPQRGRKAHLPFSGSQPVPGGGARERARNIARAEKAAKKALT
jgi:hypothetical protein